MIIPKFRPMFMEEKPSEIIKAKRGLEIRCKTWEAEAALRMLENNIDPTVCLSQNELVVYGGSGRAARNWKCFNNIVKALMDLESDETLLIQSGKPIGILKTFSHCPKVLIANSNIVPTWSTQNNFDIYDKMGLTMYGQMTAGSWIYIGTQGILQGTYETFGELSNQYFDGSLAGTITLTGGLGGMGGAQPLAVTMNEGVVIDVECRRERIVQKVNEGYCDILSDDLDQAINIAIEAKENKKPLSIGLCGNAADIFDKISKMDFIPDIVTDQTSSHNLLDYVPEGNIDEILNLRVNDPEQYKQKARTSISRHCSSMIKMQQKGAIVFDYGNNLRGEAERNGTTVRDNSGKFLYPGFVPAYIRPLFCQGKGPFRWVALSGNENDIRILDEKILELFPEDKALYRWITLASKKVPFIGLPARVCWLGYGDRAKFGVEINNLVANKTISAPIVIGRDHLDCGSVASPNRETEGMKDGSDAIADWPFLNAMGNVASGADWVSIHNGGGVGIGNSTHAGMVIVATGTVDKSERLKRTLTTDPALGIMRHVDSGYDIAMKVAAEKHVKIPGFKYSF